MKRSNQLNINTPEYWEKYTGAEYYANVRKSGEVRYSEVAKHITDTSTLLDVGCNFGDFLSYLTEEKITFRMYDGFDFSHTAIDKAKLDFPESNWQLGDCQTLDIDNNKYDTIVAMQMLEHIDDPAVFIQRAYDKLLDDGKLIITVPNDVKIQHASHVWFFDSTDLKNMLYSAGFRNIEINSINNDNNLIAIATKLKKISVVTPVLCPSENVFTTIKQCFESIRKAVDAVNGEWIIVDDNSAVGQEYFSKIADVYIRNNTTTGVSTSLNRGMKISSGSFVVKLDSDYLVPDTLFKILLADWSDDLCFIAPSFTGGAPSNMTHYDISKLPTPEGGVIDKPSGLSKFSKYAWGGGIVMFDAKKIREINYFDEMFNIGSAQDNDVIHRLLMKGHNWRWSNNVLTRHFASISSNDPNAPDTRAERRRIGREIFVKKHGFEPGGFISKIFQHFKYAETK